MKRVIAFVLLGLMIYAGGFILVYGIGNALEYSSDTTHDFNAMKPDDFGHNVLVEGSVSYLKEYYLSEGSPGDKISEMYADPPKIFGIPIGKQKRVKRYLAEVGYTEKKEDKIFCIIAFCEEDIEQADNTLKNGTAVEFSGIIKDSDIINAKNNNMFINNPDSNIIPYVIYVADTDELFNTLPTVIVGAVLLLVGAGGATLLIIRIKHEREGY